MESELTQRLIEIDLRLLKIEEMKQLILKIEKGQQQRRALLVQFETKKCLVAKSFRFDSL